MSYCKAQILLGSDSSGTSPHIFVGDCRLLTISVQTSTGSASNVTVSLSNSDGLQSSDLFYSVATVLTSQGIFTVDPGARWLKAERANIATSAASNATVTLNRYYE